MKTIKLKEIEIDGGTQPRLEIDESIVSEYAEAMKSGDTFPPVIVFNDGARYWLADGFHRTHAARRVNVESLPAEIHVGTKRDAILYSVGANSAHGLRRSNADKRKAVLTLLQDGEWGRWSDREIARRCGVAHTFVGDVKRGITNRNKQSLVHDTSDKPPRTYTDKHGNKSTMNTENIGKSRIKNEYVKDGRIQKPRESRAQEIERLAQEGYRSEQISDELGVSVLYVRRLARRVGIELPDAHFAKSTKINARRVVEQTVIGLSGYANGLQLISGELQGIDLADAKRWADELGESIKPINRLKKRLQEIANG